jgi:hypothetical protein
MPGAKPNGQLTVVHETFEHSPKDPALTNRPRYDPRARASLGRPDVPVHDTRGHCHLAPQGKQVALTSQATFGVAVQNIVMSPAVATGLQQIVRRWKMIELGRSGKSKWWMTLDEFAYGNSLARSGNHDLRRPEYVKSGPSILSLINVLDCTRQSWC